MEWWSRGAVKPNTPSFQCSIIPILTIPSFHYSILPLFQSPLFHCSNYSSIPISSCLLLPFKEFEPHAFGTFEETDSTAIGQYALFENFQACRFYFGDFDV